MSTTASADRRGDNSIRTFGTKASGISYVPRPSTYAFIHSAAGLALVRTPMGLFLPGGGLEAGEDPVAALRRELTEELGFRLEHARWVGQAAQYHWSRHYQKHYFVVGEFFFVTGEFDPSVATQAEHALEWHSLTSAAEALTQEFQRWAVDQYGHEP